MCRMEHSSTSRVRPLHSTHLLLRMGGRQPWGWKERGGGGLYWGEGSEQGGFFDPSYADPVYVLLSNIGWPGCCSQLGAGLVLAAGVWLGVVWSDQANSLGIAEPHSLLKPPPLVFW